MQHRTQSRLCSSIRICGLCNSNRNVTAHTYDTIASTFYLFYFFMGLSLSLSLSLSPSLSVILQHRCSLLHSGSAASAQRSRDPGTLPAVAVGSIWTLQPIIIISVWHTQATRNRCNLLLPYTNVTVCLACV